MRKLVLLFLVLAAANAFAGLDARTIIQRSVEANDKDFKEAPNFNHFERDQQDGHTRTFQVLMILGSPYHRLVAVDGKPLTGQQQAQEEKKLQAAIARRSRETSQQRAQRIAKYEKDRQRDYMLMQQLTEAFNFTLQGEQKLGPYQVYVLDASPRPGYQPPNTETQVLTGMKGKLWIDTQSFQWVKVEAEVVHPVSIAGFLAKVEPGTRFELEKMPVSGNVWLPRHFAMKATARILGLFSHNSQEDEHYFDYHRAAPVEAAGLPPKYK
jgi:hypothetical protein